MTEQSREHLGDGVYAEIDNGEICLTTVNSFGVTVAIHLEPGVCAALVRFAERAWPAVESAPQAQTWVDPRTGLTWQVEPASEMLTWEQAKEHAAGLGNGWRLPTREELEQISGPNRPRALHGKGWFWSSSPVEGPDDRAWLVYFASGRVGFGYVLHDFHVRCVR
jgi:hypothetical protein